MTYLSSGMVPYIGITDFMTSEQSLAMLSVMAECQAAKQSPRKLMIGVMMSCKTLNDLPSKWANVFPPKAGVASIFVDHPLAFNTLHYADYEESTTMQDIAAMMRICLKGSLHAVQLDMPWPDWALLEVIKRESEWRVKTVLQVGKKSSGSVQKRSKRSLLAN